MEHFTISLAEIPIGITPVSPAIKSFFADYLIDENPRFVVAVNRQDLEYEQIMFDKRNRKDCPSMPRTAYTLETSAILRKIANRILEYDTILFHGSAVAVDGKAYLFAAPSGTGKTTHTGFWLQQLPQAYVLNGDKPFLKVARDGRILACGTPWQGKEKLGCNEILPLDAICLLERAPENSICSISIKNAIQALLRQTHLPVGTDGLRAIQLLDQISRGVRLFRLWCNMDPESALVSIQAMIPD